MKKQKIIVFGAGAVGGFFGGLIAENTNHDVLFTARGTHYQAIKDNGLTIKTITGQRTLKVEVTDSLTEYSGYADLIIVTVKAHDTSPAIEQLRPVIGTHTQILTIQNGLWSYEKLSAQFGAGKVIRGLCRIGVEVTSPGVITHSYLGVIVFGEDSGAVTTRIDALEELFIQSGIEYNISADIRRAVWKKFTWNSIFNILSGILNVTLDKLYANPETIALCEQIACEIQRLAAKDGVTLTAKDMEWILSVSSTLGQFRTSTFQDRQKGKPLEYDTFTGYIVRLAEKYAVPVPINSILLAMIKAVNA
ncbi:ketopantoate reductase family protein [bacterium]|nr:ketopantoate reductase family protein [bacterium]